MSPVDPETWRADSRAHWDASASGWGANADVMSDWTVGVSATMIEALALSPGERVLELAAGPGDTGFMAAELVAPGGTLICSDGSEAMLDVARERAAAQGVQNVEFKAIDLEWIDLPTADVDAVLCRWGLMLVVDPEAAAREIRRVLRSGGRVAVAVWDAAERNPWTTIPRSLMHELGHTEPPDPAAPNQFSLSAPGALAELLENAGLLEVDVTAVALQRTFADLAGFVTFIAGMMAAVGGALRGLDESGRAEFDARLAERVAPFTDTDGTIVMPGSTLVAAAVA